MGTQIWFARHYAIKLLESMAEVRSMFEGMQPGGYEMNWLFCSTSGVHGTYTTIDGLEADIRDPAAYEAENGEPLGEPFITVLIVQPRVVCVRYGHIPVTLDDLAFLREHIAKTLVGVAATQAGNLTVSPEAISKEEGQP